MEEHSVASIVSKVETFDRGPPILREEMPIAFSHLFGLVPHHRINHTLINTFRRQIAGKGMSKRVESDDDFLVCLVVFG